MAVVTSIGSTQVFHCEEVFQGLISLHNLHLLLLPVTDLQISVTGVLYGKIKYHIIWRYGKSREGLALPWSISAAHWVAKRISKKEIE